MPSRTLSPRMSTIVTTMLSPIMMLSSRCLESTSIAGSFLILSYCRRSCVGGYKDYALFLSDGRWGLISYCMESSPEATT